MINRAFVYELTYEARKDAIRYYFESEGEKEILKAIQYKQFAEFDLQPVFNFGFGNYDPVTDQIDDQDLSNNGDEYYVFNTVLSTIPEFFNLFPGGYIQIMGSDSEPGFPSKCRLQCKKNCPPGKCRDFRRRINIYRNYLHKNWNLLSIEYKFMGGTLTQNGIMITEVYDSSYTYDAILVSRINN